MTECNSNGVAKLLDWTSRPSKGAAAELIASAFLMKKGYHLFRAVSPCTPCDLIAMMDRETYRVEVKSLTLFPTGPSFSRPSNEEWDILLVVDTENFKVFEFDKTLDQEDTVNKLRAIMGYQPSMRHQMYVEQG